jgi:hypothetical protein
MKINLNLKQSNALVKALISSEVCAGGHLHLWSNSPEVDISDLLTISSFELIDKIYNSNNQLFDPDPFIKAGSIPDPEPIEAAAFDVEIIAGDLNPNESLIDDSAGIKIDWAEVVEQLQGLVDLHCGGSPDMKAALAESW